MYIYTHTCTYACAHMYNAHTHCPRAPRPAGSYSPSCLSTTAPPGYQLYHLLASRRIPYPQPWAHSSICAVPQLCVATLCAPFSSVLPPPVLLSAQCHPLCSSQLGAAQPRALVLTGPNMGGKSTVLREVWMYAMHDMHANMSGKSTA